MTRSADALRLAGDGDTIEVLHGTYSGDVAVIHQRRLDIVGLGAQPVLDAAGRHAEGKAIWVVRDGDIRIHNIGFRSARVPDSNGAGIRFERGRLQLQACSFHDNQNGILTGADIHSVLEINHCQFSHAPETPATPPHLLYIGRIGLFVMRDSLLQQGNDGHLGQVTRTRNTVDWQPTGQRHQRPAAKQHGCPQQPQPLAGARQPGAGAARRVQRRCPRPGAAAG